MNCYLYKKILRDNEPVCPTFNRQVTESLKPKEDMIAQLHWYRVFELGLLGVEALLRAPWVLALGVCFFFGRKTIQYIQRGADGKKKPGTKLPQRFRKKKSSFWLGTSSFFFCVLKCVSMT